MDDLDVALIASIAWKEAEDTRARRMAELREKIEAEDLHQALALSLTQEEEIVSPETDRAVAESLSLCWECTLCLALNSTSKFKCVNCGVFSTTAIAEAAHAEYEAEDITTGTKREQCGLPGCTGSCVHAGAFAGFCSARHCQLARERGFLAPAHAHIERSFIGPGEGGCETWSAHLLTRYTPSPLLPSSPLSTPLLLTA